MVDCPHSDDWPCTDCLHPDRVIAARQARTDKLRRKMAQDAAPPDPTKVSGASVDRLTLHVLQMLPVRDGGLGTRCPICEVIYDDHGYCACARAKEFDRNVQAITGWIDGIPDEDVRTRQGWIAMSALRRSAFKVGRSEPIEHGEESIPLIAAVGLNARCAFGKPAAWVTSRNAVADELPL